MTPDSIEPFDEPFPTEPGMTKRARSSSRRATATRTRTPGTEAGISVGVDHSSQVLTITL
jgi:hypothetical protein